MQADHGGLCGLQGRGFILHEVAAIENSEQKRDFFGFCIISSSLKKLGCGGFLSTH